MSSVFSKPKAQPVAPVVKKEEPKQEAVSKVASVASPAVKTGGMQDKRKKRAKAILSKAPARASTMLADERRTRTAIGYNNVSKSTLGS